MARIPNDKLEHIKRNISLLDLVKSQGYTVTKQGKDYVVLCPFHDEQTPSCVISPKTNLFNCFGCGAGGSVIDWVMKTQNMNFRDAVMWLDNTCASEKTESVMTTSSLAAVPSATAPSVALSPASMQSLAADNQTLLHRVIDFYHDTLKQSQEAQEYLQKRGLDNAELVNYFKLGYANRSLGLTLPEKNRKAGAEIRNHLQHVGLYRESGHEHFNGSLVVPVINQDGKVTEIYGRKLLDNLRKGTPKHLYLPGPHEGVFNPVCLMSEEIILCESLIDALTFWRWGFKNVTTSYGTQGFTDEMLAAFKNHSVKRVLIAYDRDKSGDNAAEKLAVMLNSHGIDCYRILFPKNMDANEYALKVTPAEKSLALVVRQAEWVSSGREAMQSTALQDANGSQGSETGEMLQGCKPTKSTPDVSPLPPLPSADIEAHINAHEIIIPLSQRVYRVRGFDKNLSYEQLKINLLVMSMDGRNIEAPGGSASTIQNDAMHVDMLDLYSAKARQHFIKQASIELGVSDDTIKHDLGKVLLKLEALQDENIKNTLENKGESVVDLTNEEHSAALSLLKSPDLMQRILADFKQCGVVGEDVNKLTAYLAACSRKLDKPLAIMVQSSSAAGKSSLMDAVLSFMPEEERVQYSAMTGQSLFYMGEQNLKNKILAIAEEEGASNTSYALKLLQSEGEVSIASTGKNPTTGNLETQEYKVEGPVMLFSTTTAIDIDEELMNRCLVLSVDESRAQTEAIHNTQRLRRTLNGIKTQKDKDRIKTLHQNAQRLLKPLFIVNPYADQLTFLSDKTRTRRDHEKYLSLIDTVTLVHQYQRDIKTETYEGETLEYIEVTLDDIALANELSHEVLGRSLDELPPQTRRLLHMTQTLVTDECRQLNIKHSDYRFMRKDVRQASGWTDFQVKKHLQRLEEMEYLLVHTGGRGKSIVYELLYQGEGDARDYFLMGLVDVKKLGYDSEKEPLFLQKAPPNSAQKAPKVPVSSMRKNAKNTINTVSKEINTENIEKNTYKEKINGQSHPRYTSSPLAAHAHTEGVN